MARVVHNENVVLSGLATRIDGTDLGGFMRKRNVGLLALCLGAMLLATGCDLYLADDDGYYYCDSTGCYYCDDYGCVEDTGNPPGLECDSNTDCMAGCYCAGGVCEEAGFCDEDSDCPRGFECDDRDSCVPEGTGGACEADTDNGQKTLIRVQMIILIPI